MRIWGHGASFHIITGFLGWVQISLAVILQVQFTFKWHKQGLVTTYAYIFAGCWVAFLGQPRQRLSPPAYWFIRGDLEPPCHMLPQMGTSPQAIQALWQQAWAIMAAREKGEKELRQRPRQCVCTFTYMDYRAMSMCQVICMNLCPHVQSRCIHWY